MATSEARTGGKRVASRGIVWLVGVVALCLAGVGAYVYSLYTPKQVMIAINDDPPITVEVSGWTVGHALKAAGIAVYEGDEVSPSLTGRITEGSRITIARGTQVTLHVDGEIRQLVVPHGTVRDALVRGQIRMGSMDRVVPVRETPLEEGMEIRVIRVTQEEVVETEGIPYRTLRWAEPHLAKGERRVVREGREGILQTRLLLTYENGELAHRQVLSTEVIEEPVAEIIGEGTPRGAGGTGDGDRHLPVRRRPRYGGHRLLPRAREYRRMGGRLHLHGGSSRQRRRRSRSHRDSPGHEALCPRVRGGHRCRHRGSDQRVPDRPGV